MASNIPDYAQVVDAPNPNGGPLTVNTVGVPLPIPDQVGVPLPIPDQVGVPLPIPDQVGVPLPIPDQVGVPIDAIGDQGRALNLELQANRIKQAVAAGYSYQDIVDHHEAQGLTPPVRPPLADIYAGVSVSSYGERGVGASADGSGNAISKSTYPSIEDLSKPGRDKITEGAGPIGEVILGAGAGGVAGALKGAISTGVLGDVSGAVEGRIASMGVTTSTAEAAGAGAKALAAEDVEKAVIKAGLKYGTAGEAAREVFFTGLPGDAKRKDRSGLIEKLIGP